MTPFEPGAPAECLFSVTIKARMGPKYRSHSNLPGGFPDRVVTGLAARREGPSRAATFYIHCCPQQETGLACSAVSGSLGPGPARGPSTFRRTTASAQVSRGCPHRSPEERLSWTSNPRSRLSDACLSAPSLSLSGLSRRVLVTNVVTGHRQSFGTSSDVLAQQFALMVGWIGGGERCKVSQGWKFCWIETGFLCVASGCLSFSGGKRRASERISRLLGDYICTGRKLGDSERPGQTGFKQLPI